LCKHVASPSLGAELLRLSDRVPPVFTPEVEPKYVEILFDFRYLKVTETYEAGELALFRVGTFHHVIFAVTKTYVG
jgi:hypothetical protein